MPRNKLNKNTQNLYPENYVTLKEIIGERMYFGHVLEDLT